MQVFVTFYKLLQICAFHNSMTNNSIKRVLYLSCASTVHWKHILIALNFQNLLTKQNLKKIQLHVENIINHKFQALLSLIAYTYTKKTPMCCQCKGPDLFTKRLHFSAIVGILPWIKRMYTSNVNRPHFAADQSRVLIETKTWPFVLPHNRELN